MTGRRLRRPAVRAAGAGRYRFLLQYNKTKVETVAADGKKRILAGK
jgi:hypothetical protein